LALTLGTRIGVYDITGPIGAGGMGQVSIGGNLAMGRSGQTLQSAEIDYYGTSQVLVSQS
jgi:hypothetical protein